MIAADPLLDFSQARYHALEIHHRLPLSRALQARSLADLGEQRRGTDERLRRNRTAVERCAAETVPLEEGDPGAQACRQLRSGKPGRPGAENGDVVGESVFCGTPPPSALAAAPMRGRRARLGFASGLLHEVSHPPLKPARLSPRHTSGELRSNDQI